MASADTPPWPRRAAAAAVVALVAGVSVGAAGAAFGPVGVGAVVLGSVFAVQVSRLSGRRTAWFDRLADALAVSARSLASGCGRALDGLLRIGPAVIGTAALIALVDGGIGLLWDRATGAPAASVPSVDLATADLPPATDPRRNSPALADAPWAERYFQEFGAVPIAYVPFVGPREAPVHGRYINSADGIRESYEPTAPEGTEPVTVWFFGGSTLWGEGQRDLHTIPSEVARLAEDDGVVLHAVNYGIRGYTAFQEFLVFEQELAARGAPDVAVFYHGANEEATLTDTPQNLGEQPSIFQLEQVENAFARAPSLPGQRPPAEPSALQRYREVSVLDKLLRQVRAAVEDPASAEEAPWWTPEEIERATDEAAQIYRRSIELIRHVAARHDVPTQVFWQPAFEVPTLPDRYQELGERSADLHIDISDALAGAPSSIYLDGLHTNEAGARLSAEAIWRHLRPAIDEAVDQ